MKALLLLFALAVPLFAEPTKRRSASRLDPEEEKVPMDPQSADELRVWLERTKWMTGENFQHACFFRGNKFETPLAKPSFTVKGRRALIMNWGKGVKVRCVIDEDLTTMTEVDGLKSVFKFEGRLPAEEKPSRLSPAEKKSR